MSKWYGNVVNRLEEGRLLEPTEGMDITMYYWSDRTCYYITKVDNPKRIHVKQYEVCADHDKAGGMGHQDWLYFKTRAEMEDYLKKFFPDREEYKFEEPPTPKTTTATRPRGGTSRSTATTRDTLSSPAR